MSSSDNTIFKQGELVEISGDISKHDDIKIGIVSSHVKQGMFGELVAIQTIDKTYFRAPQYLKPYIPEQKSESVLMDFTPGNQLNIAILAALNNVKDLPLSKNQMLLILSSANLLNAVAKLPEYKRLLPQTPLKCVIREIIRRFISNYDSTGLFLEQFYIENNAECVYIRNFGLQFSFKHVGEDELIDDYIKSSKNIKTAWDGIRLQPIAYNLFKFATEAYENDYDTAKVNVALSTLLNPEKTSILNNAEQCSRRKREKKPKFVLKDIIGHYQVGDTISIYTIDNQTCRGVIQQIDTHSIVISNDSGSQFFYEGYIKSIREFNRDHAIYSDNSEKYYQRDALSRFIKSKIEQESKKYPLADSVLRILAEKKLGYKLRIDDIISIREALGFEPYKERRIKHKIESQTQGIEINEFPLKALNHYCNNIACIWQSIQNGFYDGTYHYTPKNGGFAKKTGEAYTFRSETYTVFAHELNFARNISNLRKKTVWCSKLRPINKSNSKIAHTSVAIETGTINELQQSFTYYFLRASFGACNGIVAYIESCGADVTQLRNLIKEAKQQLSNNSKRLSCKYRTKDIYANDLQEVDRDIIIDYISQMLACDTKEALTPTEIWNVLKIAFNISFVKGNVGGLIDTTKDMGRNIYNLKVAKISSAEDAINEIMTLTNRMLEINELSEDSVLPTNAKITHFNGSTYTVQDEFSCQEYCLSKKIMVGEPSMGHICIIKAPNGDLIAATNFATYGEVLSFFRIALQEGTYCELMQTFKLLIRMINNKQDFSSKIKLNIKKLLEIRGLVKEDEYDRIAFSELDDSLKNSLIAYVRYILESKDGFEISNSKIRIEFEEAHNIVIAKNTIQQVKDIIFKENPSLYKAYQDYLIEHSDTNN